MAKKIGISILGCGWFGLPLAKQLITLGYRVNGSTTTPDKLTALTDEGIEAYLIDLANEDVKDVSAFFDSEVLVIAFPPRMRSGKEGNYLPKIEHALRMIKNSAVKQVIFISSSSVFGDTNTKVDESSIPQPETDSGKAILSAERLLQSTPGLTTTVLRFSGLIGPGRDPGRFFGGKTAVPNGQAPVNLIHLDDCIGITCQIIEKEAYGLVYHGVTPDHPSRQDFYTPVSVKAGYAAPTFIDELKEWKIVESKHVPLYLNYTFVNGSLLDLIKRY
ncbi:NAD-dependent epimerase/dehydratase [Arcticibacter svalbardensis MN12-7]|uniref:NAD-dependent epimerase/dehydratase n=1 Tax=Arcticibacter svalbardensis MN12-7 TaxID=1150600 RepID=R9H3M0_9SPHI|nr:SDR family oxidoreductase [Arcticibacter svalbardensis]EOR95779.1 NAD-dependent epimerase/dehydratase [Arcticibacter svalbardensis MN12-7]